jgi:hypothetical protein
MGFGPRIAASTRTTEKQSVPVHHLATSGQDYSNIISPASLRKRKLALGGSGKKKDSTVQYSVCVKKNEEP